MTMRLALARADVTTPDGTVHRGVTVTTNGGVLRLTRGHERVLEARVDAVENVEGARFRWRARAWRTPPAPAAPEPEMAFAPSGGRHADFGGGTASVATREAPSAPAPEPVYFLIVRSSGCGCGR